MFRLATLFLLALTWSASAQERIESHCRALAQASPNMVWLAGFGTPVAKDNVRIRYIDHSMFLIETPGGITVVTDFAGYLGITTFLPDVVTMNNSHDTHFTSYPDPDIKHVLQGWPSRDGTPATHHLDLGEILIRNVTTDTRGYSGLAIEDGNSIFVFEVAGLCIGHLGHLHHEPDAQQYADLGRVDVLLAPVDGGRTLDLPSMINVIKRLRSSVVIPMHWFSDYSLDIFLTDIEAEFSVQRAGINDITLSRFSLPGAPTVLVLEPQFLSD
ncbi:beta-lactamase fold-like Zn-dependent hydrolase [Actibacterium atlanticum]|uniref:Beta-lactamase fold-like Zn-dependent hydrolase n=1 Tax=Actibacterium atlanticum TaxID=1461693 RepID=A0A058ZI47_9RHOB|nr:MBL fold metallo-hydrolase [Actibacterium atlanticum]KCV80910.1 beta-lactamase fold-like Zn-dependent hydrolase [Actibacterium atlanticum]